MPNPYRTYTAALRAPIPQSQPLSAAQVPNSAGGYSFPVDDWTRLDRFLILGSEGGSYYATEQKLTQDNAEAVLRCINADGVRAIRRITEISREGRAPKNEPAIFALALCMAHGNEETRRCASLQLDAVCRTGTHLFSFVEYVSAMRGWGRSLRTAVARWYTDQAPAHVAYEVVKYQQRNGWSHRDLLRLSHANVKHGSPYQVIAADPHTVVEDQQIILNWIARGWPSIGEQPHPNKAVQIIWAFERAKTADKKELLKLIADYRLPREAIPTQHLTDPDIWEAMLPHLGLTALIRNLGNLTKIGLLAGGRSDLTRVIANRLTDADELKKARVHPVAVLAALLTYSSGHGARGHGEWTPVTRIVDALDEAFYKAFGAVEPSGARMMLALDVSGSMTMGQIAGVPGLTPRVGSAAMALITAATESDYTIWGFSHELVHLNISPRQRLDDVVRVIDDTPMGGTDCALPMIWASQNKVPIDTFVVYTDSETYYGKIHPVAALRAYRQQMGIPAKLVVCGMVSNGFTIADPDDAGMTDVVGFDLATPQLIADFAKVRMT